MCKMHNVRRAYAPLQFLGSFNFWIIEGTKDADWKYKALELFARAVANAGGDEAALAALKLAGV